MSKIIYNHKFTAAVAFGAAALFSMLSFGNGAEAASVLSCQGSTASSVKSCCEKLVKANGRPFWMVQAGTTCSKLVVCWRKSERCGIKRPIEVHEGPGPRETNRK